MEAHPSLESAGSGEIVLGRLIELEGQNYFFGNAKAFPADALETIENMVLDRLFYVAEEASTPGGLYEAFMRLAGPYWMSVVAKNHNLPILNPDHYLSYL